MTSKQKFLFFLGQIGVMSLARFFFQWIIRFSTSPEASPLFSATAVGALLLGFRVFDGFTDPIAGSLSDIWVSKGKKRQKLLLYACVLPGIGLCLCFLPSIHLTEALRWILLISGMLLFFIGYTFYAIPYWSLISDYSNGDLSLRRDLSNLLGAGLLGATAIAFIISPFLVEACGYATSAVIFAIFATLGMVCPYFAAPDIQPHIQSTTSPPSSEFSALPAFKAAFADTRFLGTIILLGGSQMSLTIMTSAAPFIAVELLGGTEKDVSLLLGPLLAAAFPCFLFAPRLSKRYGWEKILLIASLLLGGVYCLCAGVGSAIIGTPFVTAALLFACAGPMIALLLALEGEAITVCAESAHGDAVSIYFGVFNLIVKILNGVAIFAAGYLAELSVSGDGTFAIRLMILCAGGSLFLGLGSYLTLQRRQNIK
jgi:Na+/melibiose symporter-like transporter